MELSKKYQQLRRQTLAKLRSSWGFQAHLVLFILINAILLFFATSLSFLPMPLLLLWPAGWSIGLILYTHVAKMIVHFCHMEP